jgi:hypothetical protein
MRMLAVKSGGRLTEKKAEVEAEPGQGSQKWARWRRLVARDGLGRWVDPRSMGHLTSCSCGAAVSVDNTATPHTGAGPSISASRNRRGLRGAASRPLPGRCGATATVPVPDISGIVTPAADADRDVTFGLLRPQASRLRTSRIALEAHTQPLDIGSRQLADQRRKMGQRSPGQGIPQ